MTSQGRVAGERKAMACRPTRREGTDFAGRAAETCLSVLMRKTQKAWEDVAQGLQCQHFSPVAFALAQAGGPRNLGLARLLLRDGCKLIHGACGFAPRTRPKHKTCRTPFRATDAVSEHSESTAVAACTAISVAFSAT